REQSWFTRTLSTPPLPSSSFRPSLLNTFGQPCDPKREGGTAKLVSPPSSRSPRLGPEARIAVLEGPYAAWRTAITPPETGGRSLIWPFVPATGASPEACP